MKNILTIAAGTFLLILITQASAHEGHDKTPGTVSAPHGGIIQKAGDLNLELLVNSGGAKIYPFDHDMKPIPLSELKFEGTVTLPKKTKGEPVSFESQEDHVSAKVDAKGAYRYTLNLTVTYKGKKEKAEFNLEPQ